MLLKRGESLIARFPLKKGMAFTHGLSAKFFVFVKGKIKGSIDLNQAVIDVSPAPKNKLVKITFKKDAVLISDQEIGKDDIQIMT